MGYRIKEVSDISGVSIRMLRYYDKTGLLRPDEILENGYRDYSRENLNRLQRILYLKELDFSIPEMIKILEGSEYDVVKALRGQEKLMIEKKERLERIIKLIRVSIETEKGDNIMSDKEKFRAFDIKDIEEHKKKYAEETKKKYGSTKAYKQSKERTGKYTANDWEKISKEADAIYLRFAGAMSGSPKAPAALDAAREWKEHINRYYYDCSDEIFLGLAKAYTADPRFMKNIDKYAKGLAVFMSKAMKALVENV